MPRAVRRELALLGAQSRSGTRLPAVDLARVEDAGARRVDWVERRAAQTQPASDRQQRTVSDPAVGASERAGQQDSGAQRAENAAGLADRLWPRSAAHGNPRGHQPLPRNLLPRRQLDLPGTDSRARPHGPRAQTRRASRQRHLRLSTGPPRPATSVRRSHPGNRYARIGTARIAAGIATARAQRRQRIRVGALPLRQNKTFPPHQLTPPRRKGFSCGEGTTNWTASWPQKPPPCL